MKDMREKLILYLTDTEILLYQGGHQKRFVWQGKITEIQEELDRLLEAYPKAPLSLLIDMSSLDIREEKLPPLFPWDRMRFLIHKRAEYAAQVGYAGFQFLKEEKATYFRWIHVPENSSLSAWILWVTSRSNPLKGLFIVPLEAGCFLKQHLSTPYQMLIYGPSSQTTRHVIFKGNRLLLSRMTQGDEDFKSSLHFLSRNHPDIHEKLSVLNLFEKDPSALLTYMASRKRPSFPLISPSKVALLRKGAITLLVGSLLLSGFKGYQGIEFKSESEVLIPQIESLKLRLQNLKNNLENKEVEKIRDGLANYHHLKTHSENPLVRFEHLFPLIQKYQIRLENIKWQYGPPTELLLTFIMKETTPETLSSSFSQFLKSCTDIFPGVHISISSAPFNSGLQETFKGPPDISLPLAQVRLVFP